MSENPHSHGDNHGHSLTLPGVILLVALSLGWGLNWPAMKVIVEVMPVLTFRAICLLFGGVALLGMGVLLRGKVWPDRREWGPIVLVAFFNVVLWHLLSAYGLTLVTAGRAAIVAFTMPAWAAVLSALILKEVMTRRKILALLSGLAGMAVLMGPDLILLGRTPLGALVMLGAAITWATGTVALKGFTWQLSTPALAGWQLLIAAVPITLGAVLLDPPLDLFSLSGPVIFSLVYTLGVAMVFCHWAWFHTVKTYPVTVAAVSTLAIPVIGVASGAWFLGEPVGFREVGALCFVVLSLALVLLQPQRKRPPVPDPVASRNS